MQKIRRTLNHDDPIADLCILLLDEAQKQNSVTTKASLLLAISGHQRDIVSLFASTTTGQNFKLNSKRKPSLF